MRSILHAGTDMARRAEGNLDGIALLAVSQLAKPCFAGP